MNRSRHSSNSAARVIQFSILGVFVLFSAAVIGWIVYLVRLSFVLNDTPDASMAISLVAIPVFLILAVVVTYVIVGLVLDPEAQAVVPEETDS